MSISIIYIMCYIIRWIVPNCIKLYLTSTMVMLIIISERDIVKKNKMVKLTQILPLHFSSKFARALTI